MMQVIPTPCPACGETFDNPGARSTHMGACIEEGVEEQSFTLGMSIEEAIAQACAVIEKAHAQADDLAYIWTGDVHSTAVLWLAAETLPRGFESMEVFFLDHGQHFPATYEYVEEAADKWGLTYATISNQDGLDAVDTDPPYTDENGDPLEWVPASEMAGFAQDAVFRHVEALSDPEERYRYTEENGLEVPFHVGRELGDLAFRESVITMMGNQYDGVVTGLRKWETPEAEWTDPDSAFQERYFSARTEPQHMRVHPILDWRDPFAFAYLQRPERRVDINPLYEEGFHEVGPMPTTEGGDGSSDQPAVVAGQDDGVMERLEELGYV